MISADGSPVAEETIAAARQVLDERLPLADTTPPIGFTILHKGMDSVWLLADLWRKDILYQQMFSADLNDPRNFEPVEAGGPIACVWELAVHSHERDAFITHILNGTDEPDVAGYLDATLNIDVDE